MALRSINQLTRVAAVLVAVLGMLAPASVDAGQKTSTASAKKTAAKKTPARAAPVKKAPTARKTESARARRARLARARAAAAARALREAQTPRFTLDALGHQVPDVRAEAAIIYDPATHEILWQSNAEAERSIASITKVMTAIVVLESGADLSKTVTVTRSDVRRASTTYLRAGYKVTGEDLLNLLLVGSDNAAARALARTSPYGAEGFIDKMNLTAQEMGLTSTHYADPSGLLADNVSSAYDMAQLISYAATEERIGAIMRQASYSTMAGKRRITAKATNKLIASDDVDVLGGKTGFIRRSGHCLATLLRLPETGRQVAVVVLGAKARINIFWETRHLLNWMADRTKALMGTADAQPDGSGLQMQHLEQ